ncbi:MAG: hypothetical protein V3S55_03870 [Nitrospiraceae bacterium]
MIRQALTIAFCALVFTMVLMISPSRADHTIGSRFVCATEDAALRALSLIQAGEDGELYLRTTTDNDFKCFLTKQMMEVTGVRIVKTYTQRGMKKGILLSKDMMGDDVYLFGPLGFLKQSIHES